MFIPKTDISIAEPIDAQIDELGNNIIQMYQLIGSINDAKVPGLESILNYMTISFSKGEHNYCIIEKLYNEETHIIYNTVKTKTYNIKITDLQMNIVTVKKQNVNNNITNNIGKQSVSTNDHVLSLKKYYSSKTILATIINLRLLMLKTIIFKRSCNIAFNNTSNTSKTIKPIYNCC